MKRIQIDLRLAIAAMLAVAAGMLVHAVTRPGPQIEVLVAAASLPPDTRIGDLAITTRRMTPSPGLVSADEAASLADHSLAAALSPGEPILASLLISPSTSSPAVAALTLDPAHAVQGDLVAGDRIDIYVSRAGDATELLASDVLVLSSTTEVGGIGSGEVSLLIAVDGDLGRAVIEAVHTAEIDLIRRSR